ncbi:MAG: ATP-binding protein [bacterium]
MCNFEIPSTLFYFYIPVLIGAFLLAFLIFFSNKKSQSNRDLFVFILTLCFWIFISLFEYFPFDSSVNLFVARLLVLTSLELLFFLFFSYSFVGKPLDIKKRILFFLPFIPIIFLLPTDLNIKMVDYASCQNENGYLYWYVYFILFIYLGMALKNFFKSYNAEKSDSILKKQIRIVSYSIGFLVTWFVVLVELVDYYSRVGNFVLSNDVIPMFIPVGILIFIGFLFYAITKYQFLEIKMIAAQILTYAVWILIGSQYFFADSVSQYLLIALTLLLSIIFGIFLIKSVKNEIDRKEELQIMADRLASANDQLRKLDNAKTEFISIASHQLRTPITAIKGFASLLLEGSYGEISESVHGALDKIYLSSERLVNLIEDLLNVSRIESGRMAFVFEKASVTKLLQELYDNFILIAKTKKFYLDLKMPEQPLPEIVMDYSKIRELVSNFIDNALKYTEKGGVTIRAEIKDEGVVIDENGFVVEGQKSEFGKMIRITVSDTGIGIPREEIPYLFKKFSRGKDVSRLHVGGTGLGLYVGKAIAENHHGQVWIESEGAGKGSKFIIEVPIERVG